MTSWHDALAQTPDRKALAARVNDYFATWSPAEIGRLPSHCRPDRIRGAEDIGYWRDTLSDAYCEGGVHGENSAMLSRLIAFLTAAAERLAVLDRQDGLELDAPGYQARISANDTQAQGD